MQEVQSAAHVHDPREDCGARHLQDACVTVRALCACDDEVPSVPKWAKRNTPARCKSCLLSAAAARRNNPCDRTYACVSACPCRRTYRPLHTRKQARIFAFVCVCVRCACVRVCLRVRARVRACKHICICACKLASTSICVCASLCKTLLAQVQAAQVRGHVQISSVFVSLASCV